MLRTRSWLTDGNNPAAATASATATVSVSPATGCCPGR